MTGRRKAEETDVGNTMAVMKKWRADIAQLKGEFSGIKTVEPEINNYYAALDEYKQVKKIVVNDLPR